MVALHLYSCNCLRRHSTSVETCSCCASWAIILKINFFTWAFQLSWSTQRWTGGKKFSCAVMRESYVTLWRQGCPKRKKKAWREICKQHHWAYMSSTPTRSSSSGLLITNATACGTPSFKGPPQIIICEEDSVGVHVIKSFHTHRLIVLWIAIEDSRVNCWGGVTQWLGHCCSL